MRIIFLLYCLSFVNGESSIPECPQCKELVEYGIDYYGFGIGAIGNVHTWPKCKELCEKEPKCKYWTFSKSLKKCHFKTSDEDRRESSDLVSGNRGCGTEDIITATADFSQSNLCGFKAHNLKGHRLENGDFIFSRKNRMVLTDGQGHVKKWGIVEYGALSWQDPSTWITYDKRQYTVSNFKLFNRSCPRCTEFVYFEARYLGDTMEIVKDVSSHAKCKDHCSRHDECKVWILDTLRNICRLKSEKDEMKSEKGKVSGTRACYGENSDDKAVVEKKIAIDRKIKSID